MSGWKKVKNLFWVDRSAAASASVQGDGAELSDQEFADMLASQPQAVPAGEVDAVSTDIIKGEPGVPVQINFQEQYDLAGIPDTDEVEQLEAFLTRLDASLPLASKVAAAEAFLGAVGKDRAAVLRDAERKIKRVRGLVAGQDEETKRLLAEEQAEIDLLSQKIEERRKRMEDLNRSTESVRKACQIEEARLQAAHIFFSTISPSAK